MLEQAKLRAGTKVTARAKAQRVYLVKYMKYDRGRVCPLAGCHDLTLGPLVIHGCHVIQSVYDEHYNECDIFLQNYLAMVLFEVDISIYRVI